MAIELTAGGARVTILPEYGGRLHQLYVPLAAGSEPLLVAPNDPAEYALRPTRGGSFPMAPWPNRVRDGRFHWRGVDYGLRLEGKPHAIHGRVLNVPWQVVARTRTVCEMSVDFDEGWPWQGRAWQRYALGPDSLRMKMEVRAARGPFPAGCGWHPWFRRHLPGGADIRVTVPAARRYVLDGQIPTGECVPPKGAHDLTSGAPLGDRRLDDCYASLDGPILIDWGKLALTMDIRCDEPHVMVYTPPEAVCIEPQTCAPDAFNLAERGFEGTGFAVAEPGRPVSIGSTWRWG